MNFKGLPLVTLFVTLPALLEAQNRNVTLNWTASTTAGATYNAYRSATPCSPAPTAFSWLNAAGPITQTTYTDQNVGVGTYCYGVKAVAGGNESVFSNLVQVIIPAPPTGLTAVLPAMATVKPGGSVQFVADAPSTWSINPKIGVIGQQSGLYVAPTKIQGNNVAVDVAATDGAATIHAGITIRKSGAVRSFFGKIF